MDALPAALADLLTPANIATAIIALNFVTFAAFGIDKLRAVRGMWRISEEVLLLLAFLGGTIGAYGGRWMFRHKTTKQPFSRQLHRIAVLQLCAVAAVVAYARFGEALGLRALL